MITRIKSACVADYYGRLRQAGVSLGRTFKTISLLAPRGPVLMVVGMPGGDDRGGHPKIDVDSAVVRLRQLISEYDRYPYQNDHLLTEISQLVGEIGKAKDNRALDVLLETLTFSFKHFQYILSEQTMDAIATIGAKDVIPQLKEVFNKGQRVSDRVALSVLYALSVLGDEQTLEFVFNQDPNDHHIFCDEMICYMGRGANFSALEFSGEMTLAGLYQAIDWGVCESQRQEGETNAEKLNRLNQLLGQPDFYDRFVAKAGKTVVTPAIQILVGVTSPFRHKLYRELDNVQIWEVKRLNRLLLEAAHPNCCPKKQNTEKRAAAIEDQLLERAFEGTKMAEEILLAIGQDELFRYCEERLKKPESRGRVLSLLTRTSGYRERGADFCDSRLFHVFSRRVDGETIALLVEIIVDPAADQNDRKNALKIISDRRAEGALEGRLRELAKRGEVSLLNVIGAAIDAISHMKIGSTERLKEAWLKNTLSKLQLVIRQMEKAVAQSIVGGPTSCVGTNYELGTAEMVGLPDNINDEYRNLVVAAAEGTSEYPKGAAFAIRVSNSDHDHVSFYCEPYRLAKRGYFRVKSHAGDWDNYFDEIREGIAGVSLGSSDCGHITFKGCLFYSPTEPKGLIWLRVEGEIEDRDKISQELLAIIKFLSQEGGINRQKQCVLRPPLDALLAERGSVLPQYYALGQLLDILEGRETLIREKEREPVLAQALTREVIIQIPLGLHAREARALIEIASKFQSSITLQCGERKTPASSIIGLITLGASHGTTVAITAQGEDQEEAIAAVVKLFELT